MRWRIRALAGPFVAAVLLSGALNAQWEQATRAQTFAVTSAPGDATELPRVDALILQLTLAGELELTGSRPDRALPGRVHDHFGQVHRGVPVHGGGFARQRQNGATVSVFGALSRGIDIDTTPTLGPDEALERLEQVASAAPATSEPPTLVIYPTPIGRPVLAWSAVMGDYRTHFIDAHTGEPAGHFDHRYHEATVGMGPGVTGEPQKLSTWHTGQDYETRDRLRPGETITLDADASPLNAFLLLIPNPGWEDLVATDDDNDWEKNVVVATHANLGLTYDYLHKRQDRHGYDGQNGRLFAITNIGDSLNNALFIGAPFGPQGTGAVMFGEYEGTPVATLDIAAHEVMHGVTYSSLVARTGQPFQDTLGYVLGPSSFSVADEVYRCGDIYEFESFDEEGEPERAPLLCLDEDGEPTRSRHGRFALFLDHGGAINEAYSDILGTAVEHEFHPPGDGLLRADYAIGEDTGRTIRRMDAPRTVSLGGGFTYPDAVGQEFRFVAALVGENLVRFTGLGRAGNRYFRASADDYSGVHWNSTILSHAFYLAVEGGQHRNGQTVEGAGHANRNLVEQAFFRAMVDLAPARTGFVSMGLLIRQAARDLHGAESATHAAIDQALTAVGI